MKREKHKSQEHSNKHVYTVITDALTTEHTTAAVNHTQAFDKQSYAEALLPGAIYE